MSFGNHIFPLNSVNLRKGLHVKKKLTFRHTKKTGQPDGSEDRRGAMTSERVGVLCFTAYAAGCGRIGQDGMYENEEKCRRSHNQGERKGWSYGT